MEIAENCVVGIHYTLTDTEGSTIDASAEGAPLVYLHGAKNIIPGLENELAGKKEGDALKVTVKPEEGYGQKVPELVQEVPRTAFPEDAKLEPGMRFSAQSEAGETTVVVTEVGDENVTVDGNHPLAGQTLNFDVTVDSVRQASEEELAHGHVHS